MKHMDKIFKPGVTYTFRFNKEKPSRRVLVEYVVHDIEEHNIYIRITKIWFNKDTDMSNFITEEDDGYGYPAWKGAHWEVSGHLSMHIRERVSNYLSIKHFGIGYRVNYNKKHEGSR